MYKKFFAAFMLITAVYCVVAISQSQAKDFECAKGFTKTKARPLDYHNYYCLNPNTGLSYTDKGVFFINGVYCGSLCNLDGTNCREGRCNAKGCEKGYTELRENRCYNPATRLSYEPLGSSIKFYLNGGYCGSDCNFDGTGCSKGICSEKEMEVCEKGYTRTGDICYNPVTHLSYEAEAKSRDFYLNGDRCGYDCSPDGTNCRKGFCNTKDCGKGYTEIKKGKCYNPQNHLAYSYDKNFTLNGYRCGRDCNFDGTGCKEGVCNVADCKEGFKNLSQAYIETTAEKIYNGLRLYNAIPGRIPGRIIVMCYNDFKTKGYDVFKPEEKIDLLFKFVDYRVDYKN